MKKRKRGFATYVSWTFKILAGVFAIVATFALPKTNGAEIGLNCSSNKTYTSKNILDKLAIQHTTDKTEYYVYDYTTYYHSVFKDRREEIQKVLEIGIGTEEIMKFIPNYKIGASLYMWRDYFPNAEIYGFDIDEKTMFTSERIHTLKGNQGLSGDLFNLIENFGGDYDLIVDDGSHLKSDQLLSAIVLLYYLKPNGYYVIENIDSSDTAGWLIQQLEKLNYKCEYHCPNPNFYISGMLVITK